MALSEQEILRREALTELRNLGIEPYPAAEFITTSYSSEILADFEKFEGNTSSELFEFYKSCYSILLGYYPSLNLDYFMPNYHFNPFGVQFLNDILAPIYNCVNVRYTSKTIKIDNLINPNEVTLSSKYQTELFGKAIFETRYHITILANHDLEIENTHSKIKYTLRCEPYYI